MSVVSTLHVPGPWRVDDLERLPDDGHRYEIVDGVLLVNAAPVPRHQRVLVRLALLLDQTAADDVWVIPAPLDVVLADDTVVEPDIVVAEREAFGARNLPTTPLLAIEVLSPSTRAVDLNLKRERYERAGIASYWVIDPEELRLVALELRAGVYAQVADVGPDDTWTALRPFRVTIRPGDLI